MAASSAQCCQLDLQTMNSEKVVEELKLLRKVPQEPLKEGTWK
jgi:hypothetical protein